MNPSLIIRRFMSRQRWAWVAIAAMLAGGGQVLARDQAEVPPKAEDYVFKPVEITPSPADGYYLGRFLFINKSTKQVMVSGFDEPIDGKFQPRFERYQILKDGAGSFQPFVGNLEVTPGIELDGTIRIDFESDEVRNFDTEYRGWFFLKPREFSPEWFRKTLQEHVRVNVDVGARMALDDGSFSIRSPMRPSIDYKSFDKSKPPSQEDAEKLFRRMLAVLDGWLV